MADSTTPPQRPLEGLINDAKEGRLTVNFNQDVRVNAEEFAYIERDCQAFKDSIRNIQQIAKEISSDCERDLFAEEMGVRRGSGDLDLCPNLGAPFPRKGRNRHFR